MIDTPVPAVDATAATAAAIITAIGTLNTTKADNPNCNYFVVNVPGAIPTTLNVGMATVTNFVSGDRIEIKATSAVSSVTVTAPTGWTSDKTSLANSIILTKN